MAYASPGDAKIRDIVIMLGIVHISLEMREDLAASSACGRLKHSLSGMRVKPPRRGLLHDETRVREPASQLRRSRLFMTGITLFCT